MCLISYGIKTDFHSQSFVKLPFYDKIGAKDFTIFQCPHLWFEYLKEVKLHIYRHSYKKMTHTVSLLWAFHEFATHTGNLLWAIREIVPMNSPCNGSSELIVILQWCLTVRYFWRWALCEYGVSSHLRWEGYFKLQWVL